VEDLNGHQQDSLHSTFQPFRSQRIDKLHPIECMYNTGLVLSYNRLDLRGAESLVYHGLGHGLPTLSMDDPIIFN